LVEIQPLLSQINQVIGDIEALPNGNLLLQLNGQGLHEIDRLGNIVWEHLDWCSTHDVDRLPNGNTLYVSSLCNFAKEITPEFEVVWSWYAADHLRDMYLEYREHGDWTHINAAERLPNGNTLLCLRNLDLVVEVDSDGEIVWSFGAGIISHPHNPKILPNGNLLLVDNGNNRIIEIDRETQRIVWQYDQDLDLRNKGDADRLPNGNTLIMDSWNNRMLEVVPSGEIVWQLRVPNSTGPLGGEGLYKMFRIGYVAPHVHPVSPQHDTQYSSSTFAIEMTYADTDISTIWYRIFDNTRGTWATENTTYAKYRWLNLYTLSDVEEGPKELTLPDGAYTLYIWTNSTGYVDENSLAPTYVNTALITVSFTVSTYLPKLVAYGMLWTIVLGLLAYATLSVRTTLSKQSI
jgi:hypothetical protein